MYDKRIQKVPNHESITDHNFDENFNNICYDAEDNIIHQIDDAHNYEKATAATSYHNEAIHSNEQNLTDFAMENEKNYEATLTSNLNEAMNSNEQNFTNVTIDIDSNYLSLESSQPLKKIVGRRIIDPLFFYNNIKEIHKSHGNRENCSIENIFCNSYRNYGLTTKLQFKCNECTFSKWIDINDTTSGDMPLNESVVLGTLTVGTGYLQLEQQ